MPLVASARHTHAHTHTHTLINSRGVVAVGGTPPLSLSKTPSLRPPTKFPNRLEVLYHSITAMIGAGILGLPSAISALGWAGGMIALAFATWCSWCVGFFDDCWGFILA